MRFVGMHFSETKNAHLLNCYIRKYFLDNEPGRLNADPKHDQLHQPFITLRFNG